MSLLTGISGPQDLKKLDAENVAQLATEIRKMLIASVARTGGHLGPNLGVVELTIAVHRVFDSPIDQILFDTGHQSYVHKILTGRQGGFALLRQPGGMSGFPSRAESEHDLIENSHASTALSYADGLAKAHNLRGEAHRSIVVIVGDGALTGGMTWEALNSIGSAPERPVIVVLNDNGRTYQPTFGALATHLKQIREGQAGSEFFATLGLAYEGPVDGHDEPAIERALCDARALRRPVVVHVLTQKGAGYSAAEEDYVDHMHQIPATSARSVPSGTRAGRTWTNVFAEEIAAIGERCRDVVVISAGMVQRLGLSRFADAFPERVFDVGIAEQHAMTSAAGMAMGGLRPVVVMHATFLGRAFDQMLLDVALHRLPVVIVLDRAGVTGPDGPSHHGMWDGSILRVVPGLRIAAPRDETRLVSLLREASATENGPTVIRFPSGVVPAEIPAIGKLGGMDVLLGPGQSGSYLEGAGGRVLLLGAGPMAQVCMQTAELLASRSIEATVLDPLWLKPLDAALAAALHDCRLVVTVEDNIETGGFGESVAAFVRDSGASASTAVYGLPERFLAHGDRSWVLSEAGLTPHRLARRIAAQILG